jgi:hypothetical protein
VAIGGRSKSQKKTLQAAIEEACTLAGLSASAPPSDPAPGPIVLPRGRSPCTTANPPPEPQPLCHTSLGTVDKCWESKSFQNRVNPAAAAAEKAPAKRKAPPPADSAKKKPKMVKKWCAPLKKGEKPKWVNLVKKVWDMPCNAGAPIRDILVEVNPRRTPQCPPHREEAENKQRLNDLPTSGEWQCEGSPGEAALESRHLQRGLSQPWR